MVCVSEIETSIRIWPTPAVADIGREILLKVHARPEAFDLEAIINDVEGVRAELDRRADFSDQGRVVSANQIEILQRIMRAIGDLDTL